MIEIDSHGYAKALVRVSEVFATALESAGENVPSGDALSIRGMAHETLAEARCDRVCEALGKISDKLGELKGQ